jgi:16S rRNA (guanine527-N7)-methyltransferase
VTDGANPRGTIDPEKITWDLETSIRFLANDGVSLTEEAQTRLREYGELVIERSAAYNLIGPADRERFFTRHITECLCAQLLECAREEDHLVDIGSGAGLPGIPLAIAIPGLKALLVEPRLKKAQFLEMVLFKLGLADRVEVFQGSADALARRSMSQLGAGLATARAVSRLPEVWLWSQALVRSGGWLATFKGKTEVEEETKNLPLPAPTEIRIHRIPRAPRALVRLRRP